MTSGSWGLRVCLVAVVLFGIIWLLFIGILANHATTTTTTTVTVPSTEVFRDWKLIQREKLHAHQDFDLHYVSKRRVPNGPDPIHNRYTSPFQLTYIYVYSHLLAERMYNRKEIIVIDH